MQQLIVFIPGIMGSRLKESNAVGGTLRWHEDMYNTLTEFARNPALLKWSGTPLEPAGVLDKVKVLWKTYDLCKSLREELLRLESTSNFEYSEFSYDWRQNIFDVALQFRQWLESKYNFRTDEHGNQVIENEPRLNLVAHSMGGLVAALAITRGYIHPLNIRRLICIGTPFGGAPSAFRALYSVGYLTGMNWLERAVNFRRDARSCRKNLVASFQSFTSAYQLLPPLPEGFVQLKGGGKINPLAHLVIPPKFVSAALHAHSCIANLESILQSYSHIQNHYHFIYGSYPMNTEGIYAAKYNPGTNTYDKVRCKSYVFGDGTVSVDSATMNDEMPASRAGVIGAKHMHMCNDRSIVQLVMSRL